MRTQDSHRQTAIGRDDNSANAVMFLRDATIENY